MGIRDVFCRYYGCGSPFPVGLEGSGLRVLDLGCGTGRDCYVCAALVGENGFVTGGLDQGFACPPVLVQRRFACQPQIAGIKEERLDSGKGKKGGRQDI